MIHNEVPEGDHIYDLYTGAYKPHIIRMALELDVFSPLGSGPAVVEDVAQACQCGILGMERLLDYLASLKILDKQADEYALSADAATFLVRGKKTYVGDLIKHFVGIEPWDSLQQSIRYGEPKALDLEIDFAQDAWIESYRSGRISSSLEMWNKTGIRVEKNNPFRLLDIACGCAIKTMVLAKESPNVRLTCLDTPLVLEAARDLAQRWGLLTQVQFVAGNLVTAYLGKDQFESCLLGQITHYLTEDQNIELFTRIHRALVQEGHLVLDVPMESNAIDESSSFLSLLLWANSGGRAHSYNEYRSWLMNAGFTTITPHSERLLSAIK